jgi:hypothetical protein
VNESTTPCNQPANFEAWPKIHNNKPIQWTTRLKLSTMQTNRWEAKQTLEVAILPPIEVPQPRYGQIYIINYGPPLSTKQYEVMIGNYPNCICVDFIQMMASSLGS